MLFFTVVPDAQAIVHARGVYRQVPLYLRGQKLYAKYGAGFVRLSQGGSTSAPNVKWSEIDAGDGRYQETGGYVAYIAPPQDVTAIEGSSAPALAAE
jgi:hypothetical protein